MFEFRHPRMSSVVLLAFFWGTGYLVGAGVQREQSPDPASSPTPGLIKGVEREHVGAISDSGWVVTPSMSVPPSVVLIEGISGYVTDYGNALFVTPLEPAGVYTTSSFNDSLIISFVPVPPIAEVVLPPRDNFY